MARAIIALSALLALVGCALTASAATPLVFSDNLDNRAGTLILAGNYSAIPFVPGGIFPTPTFMNGAACAPASQYAAALVNTVEDRPYVFLSYNVAFVEYAEFFHTAFAVPGNENPSLIQNKLYLMGCFSDKSPNTCKFGVKDIATDAWLSSSTSVTLTPGHKYTLLATVHPGQTNSGIVLTLIDRDAQSNVASASGTFGAVIVRKFGVVFGGKTAKPVCTDTYYYFGGTGEADKTVLFSDTLAGPNAAQFWTSLPQYYVGGTVPYLAREGACGLDAGVLVQPAVTSSFAGKSLLVNIDFVSRNVSVDAAGVHLIVVGWRNSTQEWVVLKGGCEYTSMALPTGTANCIPTLQLGDDCSNRVLVSGAPIFVPAGSYQRMSLNIQGGVASLTIGGTSGLAADVLGSISSNGWERVFAEVNFNLFLFEMRQSYFSNNQRSNVEKCVHNYKITASDPVPFNAEGKSWPALTPCNNNPNPNPGNCSNTVVMRCLGNYLTLIDSQTNRILLCSRSSAAVGATPTCYSTIGGSTVFNRTPDLSSQSPMAEHTVVGNQGTFGVTRNGLMYKGSNGLWYMQASWDCPASCPSA